MTPQDPSEPASAPRERVPPAVQAMAAVGAVVFFAVGALRHAALRSTAFDLGVYDQVLYLLARGETPTSSFLGFHFLGDHVFLLAYPLSLLYRLHPTVLWLFGVQAAALAVGAPLAWRLARAYGVDTATARSLAAAYLLYPAVYNVALFDFHPDVLALAGLMGAVLAARERRTAAFVAATLFVLACKAPLSLTVAALGVWLLTFGRRRGMGAFAASAGTVWFLVTTQLVIPHFSGGEAIGVSRFGYLGDSVLEVAANTVLRPDLVWPHVLTPSTAVYLGYVTVVFVWWISPRWLHAFLPALPTLALNVLAEDPRQRTLHYQYALPVLPFLLVVASGSLGSGARTLWGAMARRWGGRIRIAPAMTAWAVAMLLVFGLWARTAEQLRPPASHAEVRAALAAVPDGASCLTDNRLAPHLTHRPTVLLLPQVPGDVPSRVDCVLLDVSDPWEDVRGRAAALARELDADPGFALSPASSERARLYLRTGEPRPEAPRG